MPRSLVRFFLILFILQYSSLVHAQDGETWTIPLGGNAYSNKPDVEAGGLIDNRGIVKWTDKDTWFDVWFRVSRGGVLHLWLNLDVPQGTSKIRVSMPDDKLAAKEFTISDPSLKELDGGTWTILKEGYHRVRIEGVSKTGAVFADISAIKASLPGATASYVPNNEGNFFHWGRRGPSVHLNYPLPDSLHAEYFYNEVTVPVGQDIMGSYFMADGFGQGYFGMQVNSPTERHILFSVWSPFTTDDPKSIPDSQKIIMVRKGPDVHTGEFGNEGSGGQSWLNFMWKAGNTYRFLIKATPVDHGYTQFTAWFYAPESASWHLIASFKRPQTHSWLSHLHSFLENFEPEQGNRQREVLFGRQWVRDDKGAWLPIKRARFTADNTARKGYRLDYGGGTRGSSFFLTNGGFFQPATPMDTWFDRATDPSDQAPVIDFSKLP